MNVKYQSVDAGQILANMKQAGNNLNMVILDACRNNPYSNSFSSGTPGLARLDTSQGSLVLLATSPNGVVSESSGRNSLFTSQLMLSIQTSNLKAGDVFKHTGQSDLFVCLGSGFSANAMYEQACSAGLPKGSYAVLCVKGFGKGRVMHTLKNKDNIEIVDAKDVYV